jgi:hypothetical protein
VPFYSRNKEGITSVVKKREERIRSRAQETGRFPRSDQWGNCCQSMGERRGSDCNVKLNDARSYKKMYSHPEESNYIKKLLTIKKRERKGYDQEQKKWEGSQDLVNGKTVANQWLRAEIGTPM